MNLFQQLFNNIIFKPELNLLQLLYNYTNDIGVSILILALVVNLILWPLFAKTYINGQKMKVLQPEIKRIRDKYKDDPQLMFKKTAEFNKKHGISNSSTILILIAQMSLGFGLFFLIQDVSTGKEITGIYDWLPGSQGNIAQFDSLAFGFLDIAKPAGSFVWLPLVNFVMSFLYGWYTYKLAPKPKFVVAAEAKQKLEKEKERAKKKKKGDEEKPAVDQEALQKTIEIQSIFVLPFILLIANYNFPIGINLYVLMINCLSLSRQIFTSQFYANREDNLLDKIADSDPSSSDDNPDNNLENLAKPADLASQPQVSEILEPKSKSKSKKQIKKTTTKKISKSKNK